MPTAPLKPCSYPGCSALVRRGRCEAHTGTETDYHNQDHQRLYNSAQWNSMRRQQLTKDPWCVECKTQGRYTPATDVDHVRPHRGDVTLFDDPTNLQSLCKQCHSRKTATEVRR